MRQGTGRSGPAVAFCIVVSIIRTIADVAPGRGVERQAPANPARRCKLHGGLSTGPRTPEGLQRLVQARTAHGAYSAEARPFRRLLRTLKEKEKELVK